MDPNFIHIKNELSNIGISVDLSTLAEFPSGGIASKIYTVESNKGKLVIHIKTFYKEQFIQRVHEKVYHLSKLLRNYPGIPTTDVFLVGTLPGHGLFTVEEYIEGEALGDRIIEGSKVVNRYFPKTKEIHIRQLQRLLANLHLIEIKGFGPLVVRDGLLQGQYADWQTFLREGAAIWLARIYQDTPEGSEEMVEEYKEIQQKLELFFKRYEDYLTCPQGRLIHGDMINPGNVLISNEKVVGILDFEWAWSGDPPWEFAFTIDDDLEEYFKYFEQNRVLINREDFQTKRRLYRVLWLLWGANVHAGGGHFEEFLLKEFKRDLDAALQVQ